MIWLKNQNDFPACCLECGLDDIKYLDLTRGKVEGEIDIAALLIPYTQKAKTTIVVPANSTKIISGCDSYKFLALAPASKLKFRTIGKYERNEYMLFFSLGISNTAVVDDKLNFTINTQVLLPAVIAAYYSANYDVNAFDTTAGYYMENVTGFGEQDGSIQILDTVAAEYDIEFNLNDNIHIGFKLAMNDNNNLNDYTISDVKLIGPYYYSTNVSLPGEGAVYATKIKKYYTLEYIYLQHLTGLGLMDSIELFNDTDTDINVKMVTAS